jgi:hypothetical protein
MSSTVSSTRVHSIPAGILLALSVCLIAGAAVGKDPLEAQPESGWRILTVDVDHFQALFPGKVHHVLETNETIAGSVKASRWVYRTANAFFAVERHQLPRVSTMFAPSRLIFSKAKDNILSTRNAVELSYGNLETSEQPARVLRYHDEGDESRVATTELYLLGRDLYLITAQPANGEDKPTVMRRFLESVKLLARD